MKKILSLFWACALTVACYCQETSEYVEVIVTDSVHLEADNIDYTIYSFYPDETRYGLPDSLITKPTKPGASSASLVRAIIAKNKIDTLPFVHYSLDNQEYNASHEAIIVVHFNSPAKLSSFIKQIEGVKGIVGFISSASSTREAEYNQKLVKQILEKGKTNASIIATQSGKSLGKLIQVKEKELEGSVTGWTMYPPLSALTMSSYQQSVGTEHVTLTKTLVIRYGWQ